MIDIARDPKTTPVIVSAVRTPIGKYLGALSTLSAPDLGAIAIREAVRRAGISGDDVAEVIMGNVVQGGVGQAPARQAVIKSGLPATVSALTINKVCGSGLKAVMLAAQSIRAGDSQVVIAGGQESMSNAPFYVYGYRNGVKFGDQTMVDGLIRDGLWCSFCEVHMGGHAEYTAKKASITREMADQFSVQSHQKAVAAQAAGKFKEEIVPVEIAGRKGTTVVDADEGPRGDSSMESLGKLKPAFTKDAPADVTDPVVTAGNASSMNDGASAVIVVSEEYARANGLEILARIAAYSTGAVEPKELFFAPIEAVKKLMKKQGSQIGDYDLIEANEAFAVQALADGAGLGWDWDRVNVNGGAVALGHPIGASGARILSTMIYELRRQGGGLGLAAICSGGGQGDAILIEV
jgi:acetyl-CoA C-acetyltransferase